MSMRVISGLLAKRMLHSLVDEVTIRGHFPRCSYATAQRATRILEAAPKLSREECEKHNRSIPTYEQFKKDHKLQEKFAKMFEAYAKDSQHLKEEAEAVKMGLRFLGKQ